MSILHWKQGKLYIKMIKSTSVIINITDITHNYKKTITNVVTVSQRDTKLTKSV